MKISWRHADDSLVPNPLHAADSIASDSAQVLGAVDCSVVVVDLDGHVTGLNAEAGTLFGVPLDEALGIPSNELFGPGERPLGDHVPLELATGAVPAPIVLEHSRTAGPSRFVSWTARLVADASGVSTEVVATGVDVTQARIVEGHLMENARRLRGLVEATSDIVIGVDSEGVLTHVSSGARSLLSLDPDEWLGKPVFGLVHPDDLELVVENFVATVDLTADQSPMTVRVRHAGGGWVPFEVYANNQLDDPDIGAVVISMRDVTEREQHRIALEASQEALRLAERQFRMSFDHAPIGMALVGPDGQFREVNTALCHIVGRDETELLGRTFQDITHPDDLAEDLELLSELVLGLRTDYQLDKRYLRPDGSVVWVQLNVSLIRDERGSPSTSSRRSRTSPNVAYFTPASSTGEPRHPDRPRKSRVPRGSSRRRLRFSMHARQCDARLPGPQRVQGGQRHSWTCRRGPCAATDS